MTDNIKIGVQVDSNLQETTKLAKALTEQLKQAAKAAASIQVPNTSTTRSSSSTRAYQEASYGSRSTRESVEYGIARSSVGTGAESRDFAKQARGLGGLVHVYATFAANLFAVSAAFTALKNAADTTNMIKGLDQLGAASGRNLGQLSKNVVDLTDGAVSLRDAMEATAKASSAGMSNANILKMAEGAKKASQALGISMTDSLSRLSRGITKLEPELLDELGIFVRVDKAAEDYARSVGKSTTALTDFERRNAFAIATLDQLDKKFGSINMESNPYDKLLSSLKNLTQSTLELVNIALGPLVKLLAESPTTLSVALAGITTLLLKQAIPAISGFREGMRKSADEAAIAANQRYAEVKRVLDKEAGELKAHYDRTASAAADAYEKTSNRILSSLDKTKKAISSKVGATIAAKDLHDITEADLAKLDALGAKVNRDGLPTKASAAYKQLADDIRSYNREAEAYAKQRDKIDSDRESAIKSGTPGNLARINTNEQIAAYNREMQSQAAYTASTLGMSRAWKELNNSIAKARSGAATREFEIAGLDGTVTRVTEAIPRMGALSAGIARVKGAFTIMTAAASTALSAFAPWIEIIGLVIAGFGILDAKLSKTAIQQEDFSKASEALNDSTKNLVRTFDRLGTINPLERLNAENLDAVGTAIYEITQAMGDMAAKALTLENALNRSSYDRFKDNIKDLFDAGVADEAAASLANSISTVMAKMPDNPKFKEFEESLKDTLKLKDLSNVKELDNALEDLFKKSPEGFRSITERLKELGAELKSATSSGVEFKQSLADGAKKFKDFSNSFLPTDKLSQLGASVMEQSDKMSKALNAGPIEALNAMKEVVNDATFLAMFPPETATSLQSYTSNLNNLSDELNIAKSRVEALRKAEEDLAKININTADTPTLNKANKEKEAIQQAVKDQLSVQLDITKSIESIKAVFDQAVVAKFAYGAELVSNRLSAEWAKVGQAVGSVATSILGDSKQAIELRAQYEQASLSAQKKAIDTQITLIRTQFELSQNIKEANLLAEEKLLLDKQNSGPLSEKDASRLTQVGSDRQKLQGNVANMSSVTGAAGSSKNLINLYKEGKVSQELVTYAQSLEASYAQIAQITDQIGASNLRKIVDLVKQEFKEKAKTLDLEKEVLSARMSTIQSVKLSSEFTNIETVAIEKQVALLQVANDADRARLNLKSEIASVERAIEQTSGSAKAKLQERLSYLKTEETSRIAISETEKVAAVNQKYALDLAQKQAEIDTTRNKLKREELGFTIELSKERLNTQKTLLDYEKNNAVMSEVDYAKESFNIKKESLKLEAEERANSILAAKEEFDIKVKLVQLQYELLAAQARSSSEDYRAKAAKAPKGSEERSRYESAAASSEASASMLTKLSEASTAQAQIALDNYDRQIERQKLLTAEKEKQLAIEEKSAINMARLTDIGNMLGTAFANSSNSLTPILTAFSSLYNSIELSRSKLTELQAQNNNIIAQGDSMKMAMAEAFNEGDLSRQLDINQSILENDKQREKSIQDLSKAQAKSDERGVDGTMAVLSASKKLFKEKTVANKLITAMEKAYMVFKLAMMAKEIAMTIQQMTTTVTAKQAESTANIEATGTAAADSIASAGSGDPYTGIARVIAMIALMAIPLAMVGKSSSSVAAPSITSEDIRSLGSGQSYDSSGNIVNNENTGVFGDTKAQSQSIANSLEILKDNSIVGLTYQNRMVRSLDKMVSALTNAAEAIYLIPGLRKGVSLDPNIVLGSITGFKDSDPLGQDPISKIIHNSLFNAPIVGGLIQKLSQSIFGGKTTRTTEVQHSGIEFVGTINDILNNLSQSIRQYSDILITTKKSGGWFSSGSTSYSNVTQTQSLVGTSVGDAFTDVIKSAAATLTILGNTIGDDVSQRLKNINITGRIELKDLESGTDIQEYIQTRLSEIMDSATATLFPYMQVYRKFGEGMLETAIRVVKTSEVFKQTLENVGISLINMPANVLEYNRAVIAISEALVENMGGLEEFINITSNYFDKFYTAQEKLAPVQAEVADVMHELGYSTVFTIDQFKSLVQSINLSTEGGRELFQNLMDISGSFYEVASAMDDLKKKYADKFLTEAEKLIPVQQEVISTLAELGYTSIYTRQDFKDLINSIDQTTVSGQELLSSLLYVSDGFDQMVKVIEEAVAKIMSSSGLVATTFSTIITDGILGKISQADIGTKIAETIENGMIQAISTASINSVTSAINDLLITPIINSIVTGSSITSAISASALDSIVETATQAAKALQSLFSDKDFINTVKFMSDTISQSLQQVTGTAQIATNTISKVLKAYETKLGSSTNDIINIYKKQVSELENVKSKFEGFAKSLRDFADSLLVGNMSTLTPQEKYVQSQTALEDAFTKAMAGDESAFSQLQTLSQTFLDLSKGYYASSDAYTNDFNRVQDILKQSAGMADQIVSDTDRQINLAKDQLTTLGYIEENTQTVAELLASAESKRLELQQENTAIVSDSVTAGFTSLDTNLDGLLTKEELNALGLSSDSELINLYNLIDSNQDGTISAYEALINATDGVEYSINSLQPILDGIENGIIDIPKALEYLATLNSANLTTGGAEILGGTASVNNAIYGSSNANQIGTAFRDVYNRTATQSEISSWQSKIDSGAISSQDVGIQLYYGATGKDATMAAEWLNSYISSGYREILNKTADTAAQEYWTAQISSGSATLNNLYTTIATRAIARAVPPDSTYAQQWMTSHPNYVAHFASGGMHSGGVALVGEQGPELRVDGPAKYWSLNNTRNILNPSTDDTDQALLEEIRKLNEKISSLEKTVARGDAMNVAATERNTQQVSNSVSEAASINNHSSRVSNRATLV